MRGWSATGDVPRRCSVHDVSHAGRDELKSAVDRQPPIEPGSDEASELQLHLARAQGDAFGAALEHMTLAVSDGGAERRVGDYWVGYAVERAEGMYEWVAGDLVWREPGETNSLVDITVRDAGDGRFIPSVRVHVKLIDPDGVEVGTHEHPLVWHPVLYHYGRNWELPRDGEYTMRVRVEPPTFSRHDRINGKRCVEAAECEFKPVKIVRGRG